MRNATKTSAILLGILGLCLSGPVSAQGAHDGHGGKAGQHHGHGAETATDAPSTAAFKKADADMMRDMSVPYTGDPDVDFRAHMIPHHKGAIDMAKVALEHAKDADTKTLARQIIADQEREIAEMRAWLTKNGKP